MKLPNAHLASVEPEKIHSYLLSEAHPIGRFKRTFFSSLGYNAAQWERLHDDIIEIAQENEASPGRSSVFGVKFDVDGMLLGPNGTSARIRTVWIVRNDERSPRFVTAFPR